MMSISSFSNAWLILTFILVHWNYQAAVEGAISKYVSVPKPKSVYKNFCEEEFLYRPYIKTYRGRREAVRTGIPDKVYGPGFHKDFLADELKNTYICVNGLAWLYYSITTRKAVVYQTPRLHTFVHHCFMANGVPGPGPHEEFKHLLAILLVGDKKDYRRPSAQLFPAPYKNDSVKDLVASSVFVIGVDTECILMKGDPPNEFRIRNDNGAAFPVVPPYKLRKRRDIYEDVDDTPEIKEDVDGISGVRGYRGTPEENKKTLEKEATTVFCKLSYTNLAENLKDPAYDPLAFELLKNTPPIKVKGCWRPENYTEDFKKYCTDQAKIFTEISAGGTEKWPAMFAELKEIKTYLENLGVVEDVNKNIATDPCATPADCKEEDMQKKIDEFIEASKPLPEDEKKKKLLEEILPVMLKIYASRLYKTVELMKAAVDEAVKTYTSAETTIGNAVTQKKDVVDKARESYEKAKEEADKAAAGGQRDPAKDAAALQAQEALTDAELEYIKLMRIGQAEMSAAETANQTVNAFLMKGFVKKVYGEYMKAYKKAAAKGKVPLVPVGLDPLPVSVTLTIKMPEKEEDELKEDPEEEDKTAFEKDQEAKKTCGRLPSPKDTCKGATPDKVRACLLFKANLNRKAQGTGEWNPEDEWRQELIDLVSDIFVQMTPRGTISNPKGYVNTVNSLSKAYLTNYVPAGGIPPAPPGPPGNPTTTTTTAPTTTKRRKRQADSEISEVESARMKRAGPISPALSPRRPFYDQIMVALKDCKENNIVLQFDREDDRVVLLKKQGKNVKRLLVEENWEQADDEYVFNWVIDNMWFMFTSVLGICMPAYEFSIPLISSKFYTHYTEDFFYPVAREWVNNRDNQVLRLICGEWYKSPWPKRIMEASFVHSGDLRYRPPRKLYVNDLTEGNFFTEGPLKGTSGIFDS